MIILRTQQSETYRPSDVARILRVSRVTVYRWIDAGRLRPVMHLGHPRIPKEQVTNLLLGIQ